MRIKLEGSIEVPTDKMEEVDQIIKGFVTEFKFAGIVTPIENS